MTEIFQISLFIWELGPQLQLEPNDRLANFVVVDSTDSVDSPFLFNVHRLTCSIGDAMVLHIQKWSASGCDCQKDCSCVVNVDGRGAFARDVSTCRI